MMATEIHRVTTKQFCKAIMRRVRYLRKVARRQGGNSVAQHEFAAKSGYAIDQIIRWERGHSTPKLRAALDCLQTAANL